MNETPPNLMSPHHAAKGTPGRKKRYDQNFKRAAVELWLAGGKSAKVAAAELGINAQTLKIWKQQLDVVPPKGTAPTFAQLQAENLRLRRELTGALRRCDILKKTLGILSEPNGNGLHG